MLILGIDTGGTFTDFVLLTENKLTVHKVLSTPDAPERAILQGIAELSLDPKALASNLQLVHGSTVATNAVLEGKGAKTAYLTNRGFADTLTIGRQARAELYNLQPASVAPPVTSELCFETGGRIAANGEFLEPLTDADIAAAIEKISQADVEAVCINLLFSWLNDEAEQRLAAAIAEALPEVFVCHSAAVLAEYKEYERGIATWLNAYVGPKVSGYLQRLQQATRPCPLAVMQSSGETIAANQAALHGVRLLLSGPAGGLMAAQKLAELTNQPKLLTFDIGGTSTDVALINHGITLSSEGKIGRYPVAVPMVDMHTIGAGGGSLASVDDGGALQVGPQSAGANPGPACYGLGGQQATVTDANLVAGRLLPEAFLGGEMQLDIAAAEAAIDRLAKQINLSRQQCAEGILDVANEHMAQALRVISVQRGEDPAEYCLTSFGGAGGLHVCALAERLGMSKAMVPVHSGVLSALGMLFAPRGRQLSKTLSIPLAQLDRAAATTLYAELATNGLAELAAEGIAPEQVQQEQSLDLRYRGQSFTVNVEWPDLAKSTEQLAVEFHSAHRSRNGHALEMDVEVVNLRLALKAQAPSWSLPELPDGNTTSLQAQTSRSGYPVFAREDLCKDSQICGPAIITEQVSTTWLASGWLAAVDRYGNLLLSRDA